MALPLTLNPESVFRFHGLGRLLLYHLHDLANPILDPVLDLRTVTLEELSACARMTSIIHMIAMIHVGSRYIMRIEDIMIDHGLALLTMTLIEEVAQIHIYAMTSAV